jgi:hypothetical protein
MTHVMQAVLNRRFFNSGNLPVAIQIKTSIATE